MDILNSRNQNKFILPQSIDDGLFCRHKRRIRDECLDMLKKILRQLSLAIAVLEIKLAQSGGHNGEYFFDNMYAFANNYFRCLGTAKSANIVIAITSTKTKAIKVIDQINRHVYRSYEC